jgi:hypothetical protein
MPPSPQRGNIFKRNRKIKMKRVLGFSWLRIETNGGRDDEPSGSIEFLEILQ